MFTVVIPLYNKENSIRETLKSVLNQKFSDFEIIVVNDGSTDSSRANAAEIDDDRIKIIDQPNNGISHARNRAIRQSSFHYIAMIDADDLWEPEYLEEQYKMIMDFPEAGMWGTAWDSYSNSKRHPRDHGIKQGFRGYVASYFTMDKRGHLFIPSATVLDKKATISIGLFDESIRYGEDLDLFYRMLFRYQTAFYNSPLMLYRTDAENRAGNSNRKINDWFYYPIERYKKMRDSSPEFRKYFDQLVLLYMYDYRLEGEHHQEVNEILSQIDFSLQSGRWWWLYKFPVAYKFYKKHLR